MMDTILNLGLNRRAAIALAQATGDPAFVLDVTDASTAASPRSSSAPTLI